MRQPMWRRPRGGPGGPPSEPSRQAEPAILVVCTPEVPMAIRHSRLPETECPRCGSREVRQAHSRSVIERIGALFGFHPARCRDCTHRFLAKPFDLMKARWAKCPRCYRMDLTIWDPKYYHVSSWAKLRLALGANRWRCESCRCNFVSFRPRQRKYAKPELHVEQP